MSSSSSTTVRSWKGEVVVMASSYMACIYIYIYLTCPAGAIRAHANLSRRRTYIIKIPIITGPITGFDIDPTPSSLYISTRAH